MQDNNRYEFDDKFVDRAWSNMQQMLDKEMPTEQQPERKAWIWWFAGSLLVLGLLLTGVYYFNIQPRDSSDQQTNTTESPIAGKLSNSQIGTDSGTLPSRANTVPSTDKNGKAAVHKDPVPGQAISSNSGETASEFDTDLPEIPTTLTNDTQSEPSNRNIKLSVPLIDENREQKDGVSQPTENIETEKRSAFQDLPYLSSRLVPLPDQAVSTDAESNIRPARHNRHIKFGVEGSIYSQGIEQLNGIGAAAVIEMHKGQKRVYFKSAIGYQLFQPDLVEREKSLEFNNTALMPAPAPEGDPPSPDIITTKSSITELRYAYLVLAAGYKLNDHFSLEAGIMPAWLLNSTLTETWTHTPASTLDGDAGSTPFVSRISDDPVEINKRQFNLIGGLSYQPNPSLSLNLHYQHGINNILPQSNNDIYLRGAKLSACYYIR